jgi:hypothetical protein
VEAGLQRVLGKAERAESSRADLDRGTVDANTERQDVRDLIVAVNPTGRLTVNVAGPQGTRVAMTGDSIFDKTEMNRMLPR